MTKEEASRRYQIPLTVLQEYESWGLEPGDIRYSDRDLERLSLITALTDLGFSKEETKEYLLLSEQEGTEAQRLEMLETKRKSTLHEIHHREQQVCGLDCLRHSLRKRQQKKAE